MKLYIIRHGITEWNVLKKVQGTADIPLAPEGLRLAETTGKALKSVPFDICYTSPLSRARQTAEMILKDRVPPVPVLKDERLREIDFGVLEGSRFKDAEGNILNEQMRIFFQEPERYPRPAGGENFWDILDRARDFWEEIVRNPSLQDKTILISTHGCACRALLQNVYRDGIKNFWHGGVPKNCAVNILEVEDGRAVFLTEDKVFDLPSGELPKSTLNNSLYP